MTEQERQQLAQKVFWIRVFFGTLLFVMIVMGFATGGISITGL